MLKGFWVKLESGDWGAHIAVAERRDVEGQHAELNKRDGTRSIVEILDVEYYYDVYAIGRVREIEQSTDQPVKQRSNGTTKQSNSASFTRNNKDEWVVRVEGEHAIGRVITVDVEKKDGSSQSVKCKPYWTGEVKGRTVTIAEIIGATA
ncbi:MAG: hypothetical protein OXG15_10295 [Gammaproteobacteria bacterium]|nr:hypothetical protein [Gammaproteobacteria bacterium]